MNDKKKKFCIRCNYFYGRDSESKTSIHTCSFGAEFKVNFITGSKNLIRGRFCERFNEFGTCKDFKQGD